MQKIQKMKLKIKVTKEILERTKNCGNDNKSVVQNCAIALAVRDIFPYAIVSTDYVHPFFYNTHVSTYFQSKQISLPFEAKQFIVKFDSFRLNPQERLLLPELEFEIEISQEIIDTINIEEITELLKNHPTLELC